MNAKDTVEKYGSRILENETYRRIAQQKHHLRSTVGNHSLRVAGISVALNRGLRMGMDEQLLVEAALLHDMGMDGRYEPGGKADLSHVHPVDSLGIAEEILGETLNPLVEDAILYHMCPIGGHPHSRLGWLLCIADKIGAVGDFFIP